MGVHTVVVTGSSGMIGTALCERLVDSGYDVVGVDREANRWSRRIDSLTIRCDLVDRNVLRRLPPSPDVVVHLAANARVYESVEDVSLAEENISTTAGILEYVRRNDARLLLASSREVYGNGSARPQPESKLAIDGCESPYAASKIAGEALVQAHVNSLGLRAAVLRFSNVYGRYDDTDRVIPTFIARALDNLELTIYGPDKLLDFTYLDDCIDGIVRTIERFDAACGRTMNIASGTGHSLQEVATAIVEHTDSASTVRTAESRPGEVERFEADIRLARDVLGYQPTYSLQDGLQRAIDFYRSHPALLDDLLTEGTMATAPER